MVEGLGGSVIPNEFKFLFWSGGLKSITVNLNGLTKTYKKPTYDVDEQDRAKIDHQIIFNDFYGYTGDELLKATYSNYNSGSCSGYMTNPIVATHVGNFMDAYENAEWR